MPEIGSLIGPGAGLLSGTGAPADAAPARPLSAAAELLGLQPGSLVDAGLLEKIGDGEGVVDVAGRLFRALVPDGMEAGTRVTLRVVSTGPPLVLAPPAAGQEGLERLLSPPAASFADTVRGLLAAAEAPDAPDALVARDLLRAADLLRLPRSPADLAPALARLLRGSGLFHEAGLAAGDEPADLKALALRLLARSGEPAVTRLAQSLLEHVEAHQARSVLEGTLVIPFALPWGDEPVKGEWIVEERQGRRSSGEAASGSLRVRLEMPRLGPVEASFRWGAAGNAVRLRVPPSSLDAVSSRLPELSRLLSEGAGVRLLELRAEALAPAPASQGGGLLEVVA